MWLLFYCVSLKDKTCFICTTNLLVSFLNISSLNTLPRSLCIYNCYNHLWNVFLTYRSFLCIYTLKNNVLTLKSNIYIKQFKQSIKNKRNICFITATLNKQVKNQQQRNTQLKWFWTTYIIPLIAMVHY